PLKEPPGKLWSASRNSESAATQWRAGAPTVSGGVTEIQYRRSLGRAFGRYLLLLLQQRRDPCLICRAEPGELHPDLEARRRADGERLGPDHFDLALDPRAVGHEDLEIEMLPRRV